MSSSAQMESDEALARQLQQQFNLEAAQSAQRAPPPQTPPTQPVQVVPVGAGVYTTTGKPPVSTSQPSSLSSGVQQVVNSVMQTGSQILSAPSMVLNEWYVSKSPKVSPRPMQPPSPLPAPGLEGVMAPPVRPIPQPLAPIQGQSISPMPSRGPSPLPSAAVEALQSQPGPNATILTTQPLPPEEDVPLTKPIKKDVSEDQIKADEEMAKKLQQEEDNLARTMAAGTAPPSTTTPPNTTNPPNNPPSTDTTVPASENKYKPPSAPLPAPPPSEPGRIVIEETVTKTQETLVPRLHPIPHPVPAPIPGPFPPPQQGPTRVAGGMILAPGVQMTQPTQGQLVAIQQGSINQTRVKCLNTRPPLRPPPGRPPLTGPPPPGKLWCLLCGGDGIIENGGYRDYCAQCHAGGLIDAPPGVIVLQGSLTCLECGGNGCVRSVTAPSSVAKPQGESDWSIDGFIAGASSAWSSLVGTVEGAIGMGKLVYCTRCHGTGWQRYVFSFPP